MPDLNINAPDSKSDVNSSFPASETKPKIYPLKPEKPEGFKKAVAWFGGRELIASLKGVVMYAIYGENMDPRSWMKPNIYPNVEEQIHYQKVDQIEKEIKKEAVEKNPNSETSNAAVKIAASEEIKKSDVIQEEIARKVNKEWAKKIFDYWKWKRTHFGFWRSYLRDQDFWKKLYDEKTEKEFEEKSVDEFWFDYIADSGDGQMGVYGVGCMCLSDLWLENKKEIDRKQNDYPAVKFFPEKAADDEKPVDGYSVPDFTNYELLPRGNFLFVGGDTAYHSANYETLFERFQVPFRWAFTSVRKFMLKKYGHKLNFEETGFLLEGKSKKVFVKKYGRRKSKKAFLKKYGIKKSFSLDKYRKLHKGWDGTIEGKIECGSPHDIKYYWDMEPLRPFFGVPANHDYYDSIDGFNRQFRRAPFEDVEENMIYKGSKGKSFLQIPTFAREQEASYVAIRLPFDWWFFGIDSENEKLDFRQEVFFKAIMEKKPKKLILATPEPTTVFGKKSLPAEKTTTYLQIITESLGLEQPFLTDGNFIKSSSSSSQEEIGNGLCRLDLSGDVHHYARYWGPDEKKHEFKDGAFSSNNYASLVSGGGGAFFDTTSTMIGETKDAAGKKVSGAIPPQEVYPREPETTDQTADRIFDLWNIRKGGYIQHAGVIFSLIVFFFLTQFSNISEMFVRSGQDRQPITRNEIVILLLSLGLTVGPLILTAWAALNLNKLIREIKDKILDNRVENTDADRSAAKNQSAKEDLSNIARIRNLLLRITPFFLAVALYALFILLLPLTTYTFNDLPKKLPLLSSLFLLFHAIAAVLMIWLSFEYTNWLAVRFKLQRKFSQKTFTEKFEDPNEDAEKFIKESDKAFIRMLGKSKISLFLAVLFLKVAGSFTRQYSYKYLPANFMVLLAVAALVFGIGNFAGEHFAKTLADLILILTVIGVFWLLAVTLARDTGAAYLDKKGKRRFFRLGVYHWILQIFTPFVIFYYANWKSALVILLVVILFSGFSSVAHHFDYFFPAPKNNKRNGAQEAETGWKKMLRTILNFRMGAWLMRKNRESRRLLLGFWVFYGLLIILVPLVPFFIFPDHRSINQIVFELSGSLSEYFDEKHVSWIYIGLSFLILAVIGHRLSRIWFSFYLAVSVLFNGHNNEAGGMARIEGFKHILRIKVEREKLTVYVIGMDKAESELEKLKLKLVDRFELNCTS